MNALPHSAAAPAWRDARNILAVRLDNLGDVVMTSPAFAAIKHTAPGARLTLLASKSGAAALAHIPSLDDAITYDAPWTKGSPNAQRSAYVDRRLIAQLAKCEFDAAIIFTVCTQSALPAAMLCRMAGIPLRLAHSRENPYDLLTDWVPDPDVCQSGMRHEVKRQLDLVQSVGFHARDERLQFKHRVNDALGMRRKFEQAGGDLRRPYIVLHPGATAASRRYPIERFAEAADAIAESTGCTIVFSGGRDEEQMVREAQARMRHPGMSLAAQLTLGELAALIAGAQVLVCNNSGPAHIAAAQGTPVVVLYALTNPQHTPWRVNAKVLNHDVPCRNCLKSVCPEQHHACLDRVEPQAVADAAIELMRVPPAVALNGITPRALPQAVSFA
jgi:lipopolysaccharide heptosyltransferase II